MGDSSPPQLDKIPSVSSYDGSKKFAMKEIVWKTIMNGGDPLAAITSVAWKVALKGAHVEAMGVLGKSLNLDRIDLSVDELERKLLHNYSWKSCSASNSSMETKTRESVLITWGILFSKMAYLSVPKIEDIKNKLGFRSYRSAYIEDREIEGFTQAAMLYNEDEIIVILRGTKSSKDMLHNSEFALKDHVHRGWRWLAKYLWKGFCRKVGELEEKGDSANPKRRRVHLFGHSLGGALAVLLAENYFSKNPKLFQVCKVVTFGKPKVGDAAFVERVANSLRGVVWNVVYSDGKSHDRICSFPTGERYKHEGKKIILKDWEHNCEDEDEDNEGRDGDEWEHKTYDELEAQGSAEAHDRTDDSSAINDPRNARESASSFTAAKSIVYTGVGTISNKISTACAHLKEASAKESLIESGRYLYNEVEYAMNPTRLMRHRPSLYFRAAWQNIPAEKAILEKIRKVPTANGLSVASEGGKQKKALKKEADSKDAAEANGINDASQHINIPARSSRTFDKICNFAKGGTFDWHLKLKEKDISLRIDWIDGEGVPKAVFGTNRVSEHRGTLAVKSRGQLLFTFDNGYSWMKPKDVHLGVTFKPLS
mmetsp:Transcript_20850/g.33772  ORF Transcript_20850/g.33772 Transcript_20850/m.33772 type:complete len:596 (-) Transcript_20850:150-1937(-)|eukprot:jgi/Bigna1/81825/fgenesh1_pg.84_\